MMNLLRHRWLPPALLFVITCLVFSSALSAGYVWDDDHHITKNWILRTTDGLEKIWTDPEATPQYYPVAQTGYWLEYHAWKLNPMPWHAVNVLFHATNVMLLYWALRRLAIRGAWVIALLFAIHPMQVETVAWLMELKNILGGLFGLLALHAFLTFWQIEKPAIARPLKWRFYALGCVAFVLALLSKSVIASLPPVLLILLWYKRGRVTRQDVLFVLPLLVIGVTAGISTAHLEASHVGAQGPEWAFTPMDRILIAGRALCFYAVKIIRPMPIIFFYPRWQIDPAVWWQYLFPLAAVGALIAAWLLRRRVGRGLPAGLFIFAGVLFPALGFVNVFPMRYSFVADHFQYHACAAFLAIVVNGALWAAAYLPERMRTFAPAALTGAVAVALGAMTYARCFAYKDAFTLYYDTVAQNETSWAAHMLLGDQYMSRNEFAEALKHYKRSDELRPGQPLTLDSLAAARWAVGDVEGARDMLEKLAHDNPTIAQIHNDLGAVYASMHRNADAEAQYRTAIQLYPDFPQPHFALANLLAATGRIGPAAEEYEQALRWQPEWPEASLSLGRCLAAMGSLHDAIPWFEWTVKLRPDWDEAQADLQRAKAELQQQDATRRSK